MQEIFIGFHPLPTFIPISARTAFVYRCASRLSFDQFKEVEPFLIDKLGIEEVGRKKWKRLSREQQFETAYKAVSKPSEYEEGLKATNFVKFLSTLKTTLGGADRQTSMIEKQVEIALKKLKASSNDILNQLRTIYCYNVALKKPVDVVHEAFWRLYKKSEDFALTN